MRIQPKINYMEVTTYQQGQLRADLIRTVGVVAGNYFGCRYYDGESIIGIEWYRDHSVTYAENAAENYIRGIKKYEIS